MKIILNIIKYWNIFKLIYISINNESGEKEKKEFSIIEVDGIILENNEVSIDLNEKIFYKINAMNLVFLMIKLIKLNL